MKQITILITVLFFQLLYNPLFADYTYLTYDQLIFGNGGGLELTQDEDGDNYIRVLNISGSEETYTSKGFSIDGKLLSVTPVFETTYQLEDYLLLATPESVTSGIIPTLNGASFPEDKHFL